MHATIQVETYWHEGTAAVLKALGHAHQPVVSLDSHEREMTSEDFAYYAFQCLEESSCKCAFVIGGCTGLPVELVGASIQLCSLAKMKINYLHWLS